MEDKQLQLALGKRDQDGADALILTIGSETIGLDAKLVSQVIAAMGNNRAQMQPPVLDEWRDPVVGEKIEIALPDRWYVQPDLLGKLLLVSIHHPGFGRLDFGLDRDAYLSLQRLINDYVEQIENPVKPENLQ
jgi:hypothetical protein